MSQTLTKPQESFIPQNDKLISSQETFLLLPQSKTVPIKPYDQLIQRAKLQQIKQIKQIQQYRKISQHINTMQRLKKANSQKLRNLQKNVSNLDFLRKLSFKETLKIKNKRQKLQQTQSIVGFMTKLKQQKLSQDKQKLYERKRLCSSLRQSIIENRSLSKSTHQYIKEERLRLFKDKKQQWLHCYERNIENLLQQNKNKAQNIRLSQLKLKEKFKKYNEYKVYLGRLNYEKKLQQEHKRHTQNLRYLTNIQGKLKDEDKLLRKTQKVAKQTKKIEEDFYLTGTRNNQSAVL